MKNISENVTYQEGVKSATAIRHGIENRPEKIHLDRMKAVANEIFEKVRSYYGVPIAVISFFRSAELNKKIGGAVNKKGEAISQHCKGEAMDLDADVYGGITNADIFYYIKNNLTFDQLIWEFGTDDEPAWIHVSYKKDGGNRCQVLKAVKVKNWRGKLVTQYQIF